MVTNTRKGMSSRAADVMIFIAAGASFNLSLFSETIVKYNAIAIIAKPQN
jgi:hypothetical protein